MDLTLEAAFTAFVLGMCISLGMNVLQAIINWWGE